MPIDYKRLNGPEDAVPYKLFTKLNTKSLKEQYKSCISENGLRKDGRNILEHRKLFLKTGVVAHAKGSAYLEQGRTIVVTSVFDPREIPNRTDYSSKGEIYCEFKFAPFSCSKRRLHQQDSQEKEYSSVMKKALESVVCRHEFPNFQVDIYTLVLHNDGSALSAAITAAGAALVSAGIPMFDIVTSVTLSIQGNTVILDPDRTEESLSNIAIEKEHGTIVMCYLSSHEQVTNFYQVGHLSVDTVTKSMDTLIAACKNILPAIQKCFVRNVLEITRRE
ncbi:exosome complex component MTR3-like [Coccinella septempunctata]|uniref:exosome complex component MTR3-like n=1 Tax=Coccinella septempunctata TaxID=41139 RepID=UPI001D06130C|nr:exosome complex component MTR3-like [Coccinella septempunctata]